MAQGPEAKIVAKIKAYLKTLGPSCFAYKTTGGRFATSGVPDLCICYKGLYIALEVKTEVGRPTVLQEQTIKDIVIAGGVSTIVRSVDEAKAIMGDVIEALADYNCIGEMIVKKKGINQ